MSFEVYRGVDMENLAILSNVYRSSRGKLFSPTDQAIGGCGGAIWIAEDRVIKLKRFSKLLVGVSVVAARCEVSNIELFNLSATLTE